MSGVRLSYYPHFINVTIGPFRGPSPCSKSTTNCKYQNMHGLVTHRTDTLEDYLKYTAENGPYLASLMPTQQYFTDVNLG